MTAYFMASYRIINREGYEPYVPAVIPILQAHGIYEPLVADYESQIIEGDPNHVTIIIKFPSKEAAMTWYNSPEYQAIKHYRTDNCEGTVVLVDKWTPQNYEFIQSSSYD